MQTHMRMTPLFSVEDVSGGETEFVIQLAADCGMSPLKVITSKSVTAAAADTGPDSVFCFLQRINTVLTFLN